MPSRMSQAVVRRPSLPLTAEDEADLVALKGSTSYRDALTQLCSQDLSGDVGESVLLHAVFEAGLAAVRQVAEAEGYRELAAEYAASDSGRRRLARRRLPGWSQEK